MWPMVLMPMPGNLDPFADPDTVVSADVIEKTCKSGHSRRMTDHPGMKTHRHHFWRVRALSIKPVERVAMPCLVVGAGGKRPGRIFRVVVGVRVGNDEVVCPADVDPIRQVVVVGIAVIEKAACFDKKIACADAWPRPATPSKRPCADASGEAFDRLQNVLLLGVPGQKKMVHPTPAMAADVVVLLPYYRSKFAVTFHGHRAGVEGQRQPSFFEQVEYPPNACTAAVFEHRFRREISLAMRHIRCVELRERCFGETIPITYTVF